MAFIHSATATADLHIRRLGPGDLADCVALAADRGRPPERNKWRLLFAIGEAYGLDDPAGGLAGMVVLTRYGQRLPAVGMMVVASRFGGQGIGRLLMTHVLRLAAPAVVHLAARAQGRPLFQDLGFRAIDTVTRHAGRFALGPRTEPGPGVVRPASVSDLASMAALDLQVFGADRRPVLSELFGFAERMLIAEDDQEALAGFAAAWRNEDDLVIGPLVAADPARAGALISAVAEQQSGPVRVDIRRCHLELARWAAQRGLVPSRTATVMVLGGDLPGDRARLFAPVSGPTG